MSVPDEAPAPGGLVAEAAGGEGCAGEDVVQGRRFVRRPGGCRRFVRRPGGGHGGAGEAVVVQVGGYEGVLGLALVTRPLQVRACNGIMPSQKKWYEVVTVANTVYLTGMNERN